MVRFIGAGARPDTEINVLDRFWTIPNLVTVLPFLGIPVHAAAGTGHAP